MSTCPIGPMGSPARATPSSQACSGLASIIDFEVALNLLLSSPRRRGPSNHQPSRIAQSRQLVLSDTGSLLARGRQLETLPASAFHHSLTINHFVSKRLANSLLLQHVAIPSVNHVRAWRTFLCVCVCV